MSCCVFCNIDNNTCWYYIHDIHQVVTYEADFLQERSDKENVLTQMKVLREQSTATAEDYQISQSQIIAYKKQLDACKKELEEERRKCQVMQDRIDVLNAIQEQATILEAEVCL